MRCKQMIVKSGRKDELTGIYNRETFLRKAEKMIKKQKSGYYVLSCLDIDSFKTVNDQYGRAVGDEVLRYVAKTIESCVLKIGGICCRHNEDRFAILYPAEYKDSEVVSENHRLVCSPPVIDRKLKISIGRCHVDDLKQSVLTLYDRAMLAQESIRGNYEQYIDDYNEDMRESLLHEQKIVSEMHGALDSGQFEVWYQPQYNYSNGKLIGSEALVRWRHPEDGLLTPPGEFIPIFERSGFIYEMDKFIWRKVCERLRNAIDEGRSPMPVSVNVSRYDILVEGFFDVISGIIEEYEIPIDLFRLEVTESAFSEKTEQIADITKALLNYGFTVEIDDFGSGYSSLNTLKDIPAQVLKLDMKFLEDMGTSERSGNIVESVVRMAKWLGMLVIAEGVETREQAEYLKSIGCRYMQGYFFAESMPYSEYEKLEAGAKKQTKVNELNLVENFDNSAFWTAESLDTLVFNHFSGGAFIFELHNGHYEMLRVNEEFADTFRSELDNNEILALEPFETIVGDEKRLCCETVERAVESAEAETCELFSTRYSKPGTGEYVRFTVRRIAVCEDRFLFYGYVDNITAEREAKKKEREMSETLTSLMNDIPGGFARMQVMDDGSVTPLYFGEGFLELLGMTSEEAKAQYDGTAANVVYPYDKQNISEAIDKMLAGEDVKDLRYRFRRGDGSSIEAIVCGKQPVSANGKRFLNIFYSDATAQISIEQQQRDLLDNLPCGAAMYEFDGKKLKIKHLNNHYWEMVNRSPDPYGEIKVLDAVYPDDRAIIAGELAAAIEQKRAFDTNIRILYGEDEYRLFHLVGKLVRQANGIYLIYASYMPISEEKMSIESKIKLLTTTIEGGLATFKVTKSSIEMIFFNEGFYNYSGYTEEEYIKPISDDPFAWIFEEDRAHAVALVNSLLNEDIKTSKGSYRCHTKGGGYRWFSMTGTIMERTEDFIIVSAVKYDITEQKEIEQRLRVSEEEYRLATQHSGFTIARYDVKDKALRFSQTSSALYGFPDTIQNVPDTVIESGEISKGTAEKYRQLFEQISQGEKGGELRYEHKLNDEWRWIEAHFTTIFDDAQNPVSAIITYRDITIEKEKDAIYKKWKQSLRNMPPESYALFRCNLNKDTDSDITEGELLRYKSPSEAMPFNERTGIYANESVLPEDRQKYLAFANSDTMIANYFRGRRANSLEFREMLDDGSFRWLRLSIELIESANSTDVEAYMMYEDIDEEKKAQIETKRQAETDPLTGILNRAVFESRVNEIVRVPGKTHALMIFDFDNFKTVNDTLGHDRGDKVLIDSAKALKRTLRKTDLFARLGGDEFVLLLCDVPSKKMTASKAEQICSLMKQTIEDICISVSIGISLSPYDGSDFKTLYKKADAALYNVKKLGRDNFEFYNGGRE